MGKKSVLRVVQDPVQQPAKKPRGRPRKEAAATPAPAPASKAIVPKVVTATPKIEVKKTRPIQSSDLLTLTDLSLTLAIECAPQPDYSHLEIEEGQKFLPYVIRPRLLVGWDQIGLVSSLEIKMDSETLLPNFTVRFIEKMPPEDVKNLSPELRNALLQNIMRLQQFPFVRIESPLMP